MQGFPFSKVEELDQDKGFLGTQKVINGENKAEQFRQGKINLKKGDRVILMTDAIARLTLRDKSILDRILSFRNYEDFFQFITKEWENKRLEEDDITIGIIEVSDDIQEEVYLPSSNFSFPKEERPIIQFNQFNTDKMSLEEIKKHLQILDKKVKSLEEEKQKLYNKIEQKSFAIRIFNFILVVVLLTTYHYLFNGKENEVKSVNKTSEVVNKKGSEKNVQKKDKNKSNQKNDENSSSKNESIIEEKTQKVSDTREVKKDEVKPKDDNKETIQKNEKNNDIKKD